MKISFTGSMITLIVIALFISILGGQNNIASGGDSAYSFLAFNRSSPEKAATITQYWKASEERTSAVKSIIGIDYAFMLVYSMYLCLSISYLRKKEQRRWLKIWLQVGFIAVIIATAIDAVQDWKIFQFLTSGSTVTDMRNYTRLKFCLLILGILPWLLAIAPSNLFSLKFAGKAIRYLSQLLKSLWLFFPGILFLFFPIFCFWMMGQGKDILTAFINNDSRTLSSFSFNYTRIIFFVAIAFWAYVSWYSSRIIAYIKKTRLQKDMEDSSLVTRQVSEKAYQQNDRFFEIGPSFLDEFPRMIGNGCFLVLELAVLQSPVFYYAISDTTAWIFFFLALFILRYVNKWIVDTQSNKRSFRKVFWILLYSFLGTVIMSCFFVRIHIWLLFTLLVFLHVVFIYYTNLRYVLMEKDAPFNDMKSSRQRRGILMKLMDYFCIPRKESGYYRWFVIICITGIFFYAMGIFWLDFSRALGPFPFIILAFGVLLAFGNFIAAFSVRYKVNIHFLLFIIGFVFGLGETHYTRTVKLDERSNGYLLKPTLENYLSAWLNERLDTGGSRYDMYFIMANGGASRSGYWTAAVLGALEDASLEDSLPGRFSDHLFGLSGTSGGGVGVAAFFSLLRNKEDSLQPRYGASARSFLKQDYFTYTFARMLGPDFFNYIFHIPLMDDRAGALESSFEQSSREKKDGLNQVPFYDLFSSFPAMKNGKTYLPLLFVNTTRMQDGNPGVVSNLQLTPDLFNNRVDVVRLLDSNKDISITSAAILGARFPYLSPAGRIGDSYFVDGGYFDNSGAGVVQETIRAILNIGKDNLQLRDKINRINFKILHIVNSPVGSGLSVVKKVAPIKNDLMSPVLTIVGAYDMQTTVNDRRLVNFMKDIRQDSTNGADYIQVSLYLTAAERKLDKKYSRFRFEPGYAMNWFISDTTLRRIDERLASNPVLDSLKKAVK